MSFLLVIILILNFDLLYEKTKERVRRKATRKEKQILAFITYFYSFEGRAVLESQNNIYKLESYSYLLAKKLKN
jgi:hypothetical protein